MSIYFKLFHFRYADFRLVKSDLFVSYIIKKVFFEHILSFIRKIKYRNSYSISGILFFRGNIFQGILG